SVAFVLEPLDVMVGLHIHEYGDLSAKECTNVKKHWNPQNTWHGDINSTVRHVGDLGNVNVSAEGDGVFNFRLSPDDLPLVGPESILGRALVIHESRDDLGRGDQSDSNATGHSGPRLGCGVIGVSIDFSAATLDPGMQPGRSRARIRK